MNIRFIISLYIFCFLLAGCNSIKVDPDPDTYKVHYANTPIKVDGKLDEAIWLKAKPLTFKANAGSLCTENGVVKIVWDDKYLYISGVLEDSDIFQRATKNWRYLYATGDTFEVFIKPEKQTYYWELYATPNSLKNSLFYFSRYRNRRSRYSKPKAKIKEMLVASTFYGTLNDARDYDEKWITEMAIPIKSLDKNGEKIGLGKVWKFLVGRYNYGVSFYETELSRTGTPIGNNFHNSKSWGKMKFVKQ